MRDDPASVLRPDDRDLLRSSLRRLAGQARVGILFAGLVEDGALTITEFIGTTTNSLDKLFVQRGEGVGGGALARGKPTAVADYVEAAQISHQHDEAVRREGLRSMVALPVTVDGQPRVIMYAATRERVTIGDRLSTELVDAARVIANELRTRDEVDRRVALLRGSEPLAAGPESHDLREAIRTAHGELLALASTTDDAELSRRILAVTQRLAGDAPSLGAPTLTRRESDVLAQIALGCSYPEAATRLGLQAGTVKSYMQTVMGKLGAHSRHEAVATARRLHLLP